MIEPCDDARVVPLVRNPALRRLAQPVLVDEEGRPMLLYAFRYRHADGTWGLNVWAWSMEDAEQRIEAMKRSLSLDGVIVAGSGGDE